MKPIVLTFNPYNSNFYEKDLTCFSFSLLMEFLHSNELYEYIPCVIKKFKDDYNYTSDSTNLDETRFVIADIGPSPFELLFSINSISQKAEDLLRSTCEIINTKYEDIKGLYNDFMVGKIKDFFNEIKNSHLNIRNQF
jgi:hypothetical protein